MRKMSMSEEYAARRAICPSCRRVMTAVSSGAICYHYTVGECDFSRIVPNVKPKHIKWAHEIAANDEARKAEGVYGQPQHAEQEPWDDGVMF